MPPERPSPQPYKPSRAPAPSTQPSKPSTSPAAALLRKPRALILTIGFAAITVAGSLFGANLKMQTEAQTLQKEYKEAPIEDRIHRLEEARARLVTRKEEAEGKLSTFRERRAERERRMQGLAGERKE